MGVRKKFSTVAITVLGSAVLAGGVVAPAHAAPDPDAIVVQETLSSGNDAFFYVPSGGDTGYRAASTPILLVFSDAQLDAVGARTLVEDAGINTIAAAEQGIVAVLNPEGADWEASDVDVIPAVLARYGDATGQPYADNGTRCAAAGPPGSPVQCLYPGSKARVYVFAHDAGADFVHEHLVPGVGIAPPFPGYPGQIQTWTPTAVFSANANVGVTPPTVPVEVPAYLVNPPAGALTGFEALNTVHHLVAATTSSVTAGFDPATIQAGYDGLITRAISRVSEVNDYFQTYDIPDFAAEGIAVTRDAPVINGLPLEYFEYLPATADQSNMPLVLVFHGGGNHAEYMMWSTGWAELAQEHGFIAVSVNRHVDRSAADMVALLDHLIAQHPGIDQRRVYATGFSMGSVKTWSLSEEFPTRFAAFAPMNGSFANGVGQPDILTPAIYFAGLASPLPERPHQGGAPNNIDVRVASILAQNGVNDAYSFDAAADPVWGIASDASATVVDTLFDGVSVEIDSFASPDGNTYTAFAAVTQSSHEALSVQARIAWDFMAQFARNADGSITVGDVTANPEDPGTPAAPGPAQLPPTGSESLWALLTAAGLLLAGGAIAVKRRHRAV